MKLIIQIPCFNEEKTLPSTLADLPEHIPGIDAIEIQIINDGSTDNTVEVAKQHSVGHIVSFRKNRGLAAAFKAGVDNAIEHGADILVNTDADNQYRGSDIPRLIRPILEGKAEIVVGCRPIDDHPEFSFTKKLLQKIGSWVLRKVSNTTVRDAASGFRAYSRNAMLHVNIYTRFSYCMETLIQAGLNNLAVTGVDIGINPKTRDSRLFKSVPEYIWKQAKTMVGIFILYRANVLFNALASFFFLLGTALAIRYTVLVFFAGAPANAFWPSLIFAGVSLTIGVQVFLTGIIASLVSSSRKLSEDLNYRVKKAELDRSTRKEGF